MADNRARLLRVRDILLTTDEDHPITVKQILKELSSYGITVDRKAVLRDIETLRGYALDIVSCQDNKLGVYVASRDFEDWELKILIDAARSANFLTQTQSEHLVEQLTKQASPASAQLLSGVPQSPSPIKTGSGETSIAVDVILRAIRKKKKVHFLYTYTGGDLAMKYRHSMQTEPVSPYALVWQHDKYYLVGNWSGASPFSYYRLDRIHEVVMLDEPAIPLEVLLTDGEVGLRNYIDENIDATSGQRVRIELEGSEDMTDTVLDAFGDNAVIELRGDKIRCRIRTNENKGLYRWLMQYAESLKVISPDYIREGVKERLADALANYEN